jgi:YHS domain-containing protein
MPRSRGTPNIVVLTRRPPSFRLTAVTLLTALLVLPAVVHAAAPWHDDLTRAREASRVSRRPVLAIFVAAWQPGGGVAEMAIATADARALVTSCFEPVIIDVDQHADLTRRLGIKHVPTAALLGENDEVLASFACPSTTPEFVVAAAQAAQEATARRDRVEEASRRAGVAHVTNAPASKAAISMVTSKVRQLSDFASHEPLGGAPAAPTATAAAYQQPTAFDVQQSRFAAPQEAALDGGVPAFDGTVAAQQTPFPRKPPAWPAETALAPLTSAIAESAPVRPTLEPASAAAPIAAPQAVPTLPWLAATAPAAAAAGQAGATYAAPDAAPAADVETTASVSDIPATMPAQPPADVKKPAAAAQFLAALQKPFSGFARKPVTAPPAGLPQPPASPPTMAPARPQWPALPLAGAPQSSVPPAAAQASPPALPQSPAAQSLATQPQATQPQANAPESMPLGLEGYCPVTLAAKGVWTEGRAQYGVRHRGRTYLFASAAEQQTFLADPDRYAPALSGDDPVVALDQGRSLPGQRRYGVTCSSRMYLFSSPETRAAFQAHPDRYTARIAQAEQPASAGTRTY